MVFASLFVLPAQQALANERPRIGLVLGGGGAKGAAHIGVLRVLDEMRIPVDCVAGTSMGALVGATYASGVSPQSIEEQVMAVDWAGTVGNKGNRDQMPIDRKLHDTPFTNKLDLGIVDGQLRDPGGFLNTQRIDALLRRLVAGSRQVSNFDDLPIPFRAVATDMVEGEMVVLADGDLSVAMRASMAVPGAFSPVIIDDMILADGGQMRNLPIDIARDLCADVVISVSLETPPPTAADLISSVSLAGRSIDVMIDANTRAQRATLTNRDVNIIVPMGDIGSGSFDRVPDAIPLGRAAAQAQRADLQRYALNEHDYAQWRLAINTSAVTEIQVADVRIVGLEHVSETYVEHAIVDTRAGQTVTPLSISSDTNRINALGDFEAVTFEITGTTDNATVEFHPIEKSWGPNFVNFDLGLGWSEGGDTAFVLRVGHRREWLNSLGGEWRNQAQIGTDTEFETSLYQPLEAQRRFFIEPKIRFERYLEDIYEDGERRAEYLFDQGFGIVDLGYNLDTRAQLRLGLQQSWNKAEQDTGPKNILPESGTVHESNFAGTLHYDTRSSQRVASRGSLVVLRFADSGDWLGGDEDYGIAEGLVNVNLPFRGDTLTLFTAGGLETSGTLPGYRLFRIGGLRSFPGLENQQLRGDAYWLAGANYNWRLAEIQSLFDQALYAGLRFTAGEVDGRIDDIDDDILAGLALSLNARTPIGPFVISLAAVNNNSWALQFSLGRPMREGSIVDEIY